MFRNVKAPGSGETLQPGPWKIGSGRNLVPGPSDLSLVCWIASLTYLFRVKISLDAVFFLVLAFWSDVGQTCIVIVECDCSISVVNNVDQPSWMYQLIHPIVESAFVCVVSCLIRRLWPFYLPYRCTLQLLNWCHLQSCSYVRYLIAFTVACWNTWRLPVKLANIVLVLYLSESQQ